MDSFILLGKLHFAESNYKEALEYYDRAHIDSLEEKQLPPRSLKIMAEAFAIKAICLEKIPVGSTSKSKATERENAIVRCYEISGDLTLLFLQVADRYVVCNFTKCVQFCKHFCFVHVFVLYMIFVNVNLKLTFMITLHDLQFNRTYQKL